jgi:hypothetical protein
LFVIYLAVGYGVFGRRGEIGLVALRGVAASRRWVLAAGEAVVPILAGAPVGYLLGYAGVGVVARWRLGSADGAQLSLRSLPYAAVALLIALVLALLGQRRAVREPVVELLRGVPRAARLWQALTVEVVVAALAVLATVQLRGSSRGLEGLGLLVPGLVMLAVALLAARAFLPLVGVAAGSALRRGLLGVGLAAVQLARRPGSQRLFVLLAVGVAMLCFVAAGTDVAAHARQVRAVVETGASRVLRVQDADPVQLLAATDRLDPHGDWAMAVTTIDPLAPDDATVLAVDTSRLATVAAWRPEFGVDPATVAAAISVPAPGSKDYLAPLQLHGSTLELDAEVQERDFGGFEEPFTPLNVQFAFQRDNDGGRVTAQASNLDHGRHRTRMSVTGCEQGCRLVGFAVLNPQFGQRLLLYSLRQTDPPADVVPPSEFGNPLRWRTTAGASVVVPTGAALMIRLDNVSTTDGVQVGVVNAPTPVPVASVGHKSVGRIVSLDHQYVESRQVQSLSLLPRLGQQGVLVDLRYLEQTLIGESVRENTEIWLGPAAPADAADQFRGLGLAVVDETGVAATEAALARQGPALALQFHLAAAIFGVLLALGGLGLVAAVDRRARAADLRALRIQGLRRRMMRRAALWGYLSTVVLAALAGLAAALVAWTAAGDHLPIFTDTSSVLTPPRWPAWQAVAQPWLIATATMVATCIAAAWSLRRAVARGGNGGAR